MESRRERVPRQPALTSGLPEFHLGTQSWTSFPDWLGTFYPPRLAAADALAFYSQVFDTVEVNTTFHALPTESTVRNWYRQTPANFVFALKFPRAVTHEMQLDWPAAAPLTTELLRLARLLEDKCGPLLLQLPPSFDRSAANRRALSKFLEAIPTHEVQLAVELRHAAWADETIERAFAERNIAWCLVEGYTPNARTLLFPADFVYARWNRSGQAFNGYAEIQYDRSEALDWWAHVFTSLPPQVKTVYGYMADEFAGHGPSSLRMLSDRLGIPSVDPRSQWLQPVLF